MADDHIIKLGAPLDKASRALILLHGRGGTARGMLSLAKEFCDERYYVAAPQAPNNTWYPYSFMAEDSSNQPQLSASIASIIALINDTAKHIPRQQIYLAGFSQGACLALEITARNAEKYGAVIAFTGGLIGHTLDQAKYQGNFEGCKVFIGTSDHDPFIPLTRSQQSKQIMEQLGADVTFKVYPGTTHTITSEEITWVRTNIFAS